MASRNAVTVVLAVSSLPAMGRALRPVASCGRANVARCLKKMVFERLDHARGGQMSLQELGSGGALVEIGDVPVAVGKVVGGVDDDLPGERLHWKLPVGLERYRHDDDVPGRGRFGWRRGPSVRAWLLDKAAPRISPAWRYWPSGSV